MLASLPAAFLFVVVHFAARGRAQQAADWMWGWGAGVSADVSTFQECQRVPIAIIAPQRNASLLGVPPYYLLAFEPGGIPTTTMLGSDLNNLKWTANHKRGTRLMMAVMDSTQQIAGFPGTLYQILEGPDTSCIPSAPQNIPSIKPNVTGTLSTCDPWGLTITGGKKPYTVVLSAANEPTMINGTMKAGDDVYTFINRFNPGRQLMASVVDANGQWGVSTKIINTTGRADFGCASLTSSSSTSAEIAKEEQERHQADKKANGMHVQLIAGLVVGLGIPVLIGIAALVWFVRRHRQKRKERGVWDNPDLVASPWEHPNQPPNPPMAQAYPKGGMPATSYETTPLNLNREYMQASGSSRADSSYAQSDLYGSSLGFNPAYPRVAHALTADGQSGILIQHQDVEVVQELPPPYADRSGRGAAQLPPEKPPLAVLSYGGGDGPSMGVAGGSSSVGPPGASSSRPDGAGLSNPHV